MIVTAPPPSLILPDHYQHNRPAIIRPGLDLASYFPENMNRGWRRAVTAELLKKGRLDKAMIPPGVFAPAPTASKTVSFITSVTADAQTITMPTVVTGDFVLYVEFPAKTSAGTDQIDVVDPTGGGTFTQLVAYPTDSDKAGVTQAGLTVQTWGRIVTNGAGETGDVLTGYNIDTGAGRRRKTILVFRGSPVLTGFGTPDSVSKVWSNGDPAATLSPMSVGTAPFLALGFYRGAAALSSVTCTPTPTGTVDNGTTTRVAYLINNTANANDFVIDQGDSDVQINVSYVLELT